MPHDPTKLITKLQAASVELSPADVVAEAGRKVLLDELVKVLSHEVGSRTDVDPEDVHQMRVAMRRMRSLFRFLRLHYKKKAIRQFDRELGRLGRALGEVRDLDVLATNIRAAQPKRKKPDEAFEALMNELERQRMIARQEWAEILDSRDYQRFLKSYGKFLTSPGVGAKAAAKDKVQPSQIRHVLPSMIYDQLAVVRAYEAALDNRNITTFHELRIAFKRLRYLLSAFEPLLGTQIQAFIEELKAVQDCLGEMHDCAAARDRLLDLPEEYHAGTLTDYVAQLTEKESALQGNFFELWARFNTRRVQQQLASAILGIR